MEEMQNQGQVQNETPVSEQSSAGVSFPTVGQPKKSGGAKTLLIVGILVLVAILGFIIFKNSSSNKTEDIVPTATFETAATSTPAGSPTPTPKPADKAKVKIEVQNGTGIPGEAAYLQTQLKTLGYTNVTVGNASSQDASKTTVTFSKTLASSVVDELTTKLKELYKEVEVKTSTTATSDAVIITGLRKGATSKPSATPTTKASATPTAKPSSSGSATPTATPTATPQ